MKPGSRLGTYEVLEPIGSGGMGRVFRARDPRLHRDVALKVLSAERSEGLRRRQRFEREARALAALNHSNIATIHEAGYDEAAGVTFLVMELIAGEDLSNRLSRGRMAQAEALVVADQLTAALAAAHERGIVHRDLKPANIKLRPDGTVKVLDFGLAWSEHLEDDRTELGGTDAAIADATEDSGATQSTILGGGRTADGAIVGTAAYMAPEQARGELIDKRADIWAFGVVLFEMLAGRRPFPAASAADTLQAVLTSDPDWTALPPDTSPAIRRLLARCLAKDRRRRLNDIGDARLEIADALSTDDALERPRSAGRTGLLAVAAVALVAGLGIGAALWRSTPPAAPAVHARLNVTPAESLDAGGRHPTLVLPAGGTRTALEWSPDGKTLGFIGVQGGVRHVFLRELALGEARPVAGTAGAGFFTFSPDGESLAFWAGGVIKRVPLRGGPVVELFAISDLHGLTWGPTRIIGTDGRLWWIPAAGAATKELLAPDDGTGLARQSTPTLLPGESAVIYTEYSRQWTAGDERVMGLALSPGATAKELVPQASDARYLPSGHLTFLRRGTLYMAQFDARTLELRSEPVALVTDVSHAVQAWDSWDLTFAGQYAVSRDGSLAYVAAPLPTYPDHELVAADRSGRIEVLPAPRRGYRNRLALSPSGDRLGITVQTPAGLQLFTLDLERGTLLRVADSLSGEPILTDWSAMGDLAVASLDAGRITSALTRPDAGAAIRPLAESDGFWPAALSASGRLASMGHGDIWIFKGDGSEPAAPLSRTRATETQPAWSPDGRLIAYTSDGGGHPEVFLRRYPDDGTAVQVSINGGASPAWHPGGQELFYVESDGREDRLMSVAVSTDGRVAMPRRVFATAHEQFFRAGSVFTPYVVTRDGARFIAVRLLPRTATPVKEVHLVLNWAEHARTGSAR